MVDLFPDYKEFLKSLNLNSVRYFSPAIIEMLTKPTGLDFESCYSRRVIANLDGINVPIISLEDLKVNKKAAGRLKDLADLENLP